MYFFINCKPPTTTHQQKKVAVRNGKVTTYEPPALAEARNLYRAYLKKFAPGSPMMAAIKLKVIFCFPKGRHKQSEPKTTRPDTDNMIKLLKDVMTELDFWKDDAQVYDEQVTKIWHDPAGIYVEVEEIEPK